MQLMPGDIILMKLDAFQGKKKAKDRWSEVEYVATCQVANDMPACEVRDYSGDVKVTHHNRLFIVAPWGKVSPFAMWVPPGLPPLEWNSETSESEVDGVLTWCQSCSAWVGGWHFTATTISGPETNSIQVRIW